MSLLRCWLRSHEPLRKKESSRDCFILILCAFWPAGILSPFVLHAPYSFFQCHLKHSLSSHSYIKTGRAADFSHQVYLIEQLHISLSSPCMWIKAVAQSFLLPENIKAICFVLWNVRSTGEIAKALAQLRCQWTAWATDRGREPQWQHVGKKGKPGVKEKWGGESREWGDEEQTHGREVAKAGRERGGETEQESEGQRVTQGWDGLIDVDNEADPSRPSLWPIRIKLAGP